jgi:hypothetical protein
MNYKLEKLFAWIKWACAIILVDGLLRGLAWLLYKRVIYPIRKPVRFLYHKCGFVGKLISVWFWVFLNDGKSNDVGYKWFFDAKGIYPINAYNRKHLSWLWSGLRNPAWNSYEHIKPKYDDDNSELDVDIVENNAYKNGKKQDPLAECVLKWKNAEGEESDNMGETIDFNNAVMGKNFCYYRIKLDNGKLSPLYFRYSKAFLEYDKELRKVHWNWNPFKIRVGKYKADIAQEIQLGTNGKRFKIRRKWKKLK